MLLGNTRMVSCGKMVQKQTFLTSKACDVVQTIRKKVLWIEESLSSTSWMTSPNLLEYEDEVMHFLTNSRAYTIKDIISTMHFPASFSNKRHNTLWSFMT